MEMHSLPLEIHVHLEDGRVVKFAQESAERARKILNDIKPGRLFSEPALLLSGSQAIVGFQSAMVVRVDFATLARLDWPFPSSIKDCWEITRQEFQERIQAENSWEEIPAWMQTGYRPTTVCAEMELVNGSVVYLALLVLPDRRLPLDQSIFLHHFFTARGLHARRKEGGMMVVNPARIARFAFYPGTLTVPPGVWEAACVPA